MTMRMYLTDEDQKILQFVEDYGSITINQCQSMFYNTQYKGYEMARKHLSKIVGYGRLIVYRDDYCNKNVYHFGKKPSYHGILALDYYSELIKNGANIIYFKQEQPWMIINNKPKYCSDAYCCFSIGKKVIFDIIEVVRTKNIEVDKYTDIYNSREAHDLCDELYRQMKGEKLDLFPHLIVIDDVQHRKDLYINDDIKIIQIDYKLTNFAKKIFI